MENNLEVLKQMVAEAPELETRYRAAYLQLLEERDSSYGKEENGFVYHVRPKHPESLRLLA